MGRSSSKSFLQLDLFKRIDSKVFLTLLLRFDSVLVHRGFKFPANHGDALDYRALASILAEPDEKTNDLVEALYLIANLGIDERFDELLEITNQNSVDVSDLRVTAPDLATRIYLAAPQALERMERGDSFHQRRKFESFIARDPTAVILRDKLSGDISGIETDLREWLVSKKRGRRCTVTRIDCPGEVRFLIQHGDPFTRQPSCDDSNSKSVIYRPERTDFVILDLINNEMRVNAKHIAEVKLYREVFCRRLFHDDNRFVYSEKYTLTPLREQGKASLECRDIDGMESVILKELEYRWPGPFDHRDRSRASDVLQALSFRWRSIRGSADFLMARFSIKLQDEKKRRSVKIVPRNVAEYSRGEEGLIIEQWLRQRGFVLIGRAAKDAEVNTAVAGD
jgi:hypothetical protein